MRPTQVEPSTRFANRALDSGERFLRRRPLYPTELRAQIRYNPRQGRPNTYRLGGERSILLSYGRMIVPKVKRNDTGWYYSIFPERTQAFPKKTFLRMEKREGNGRQAANARQLQRDHHHAQNKYIQGEPIQGNAID